MTPKSPKKAATRTHDADDVDVFLDALDHPLKEEILALRKIILGVDASIAESIKWNAPSYYTSEHFATFHLRGKGGVHLVLHLGAKPRPDATARTSITDPASLLDWRSADRAIVVFRDMQDVKTKEAQFADVVRQWIAFV